MQVFETQKTVQTSNQYSGWNYPKTEQKKILLTTKSCQISGRENFDYGILSEIYEFKSSDGSLNS